MQEPMNIIIIIFASTKIVTTVICDVIFSVIVNLRDSTCDIQMLCQWYQDLLKTTSEEKV